MQSPVERRYFDALSKFDNYVKEAKDFLDGAMSEVGLEAAQEFLAMANESLRFAANELREAKRLNDTENGMVIRETSDMRLV